MMTEQSISTQRGLAKRDIWSLAGILIAALVLMPIVSIVSIASDAQSDVWRHLIATTLPHYLSNSLIMMAGVGGLSAMIGVGAAWLLARYRFPLSGILSWGLLLPLSLPAYISAFAYVDLLEYAGPVQVHLRDLLGATRPTEYWFPDIRSPLGAIFVISLSLYPYVYLLARTGFGAQSAAAINSARTLGLGPVAVFFRVALPLAWPAIVAGIALVMMETLNEFGAMEVFAVQTLTTGIFTTWLEASNPGGAAQLAIVLLVIITCLVFVDRYARRNKKSFLRGVADQTPDKQSLSGFQSWLATVFCALPIILGFALPALVLLHLAVPALAQWNIDGTLNAAWRTIWVGIVTAVVTVGAALILTYAIKLIGAPLLRFILPICAMGYAIPGAVLGLGILFPLAALDHAQADFLKSLLGWDFGLVLTGTAFAVIFAYCLRFFALALGAVESAFERTSPNIGWSARSLGAAPGAVLSRVYIPILRLPLLAPMLLVFVDASKELPATLLLRPFGFETLATQVYASASIEDYATAAIGALIICAISCCAVALIARAARL